MGLAVRETAFRFRLAIAACLMSGLAGCQLDRPRLTWRSALTQEAKASCSDRGGECCPACGTYQPTVWEPWRSGPMAVRCGQGEAAVESEAEWLRDLPKSKTKVNDKLQPEAIPLPIGDAKDGSGSGIGDGSKLKREEVPAPTASEKENGKPDLGAGFQLQPPIASPHAAEEGSKPALKGLESPAEKPLPLKPEGGNASPPSSDPNKDAAVP